MPKKSIRGILVKENFIDLRKQGKSIREIADIFKISKFTIYKYLNEISQKNDVERDSLLDIPHKSYSERLSSVGSPYIFDTSEVSRCLTEAKERISTLIQNVDDVLKGE